MLDCSQVPKSHRNSTILIKYLALLKLLSVREDSIFLTIPCSLTRCRRVIVMTMSLYYFIKIHRPLYMKHFFKIFYKSWSKHFREDIICFNAYRSNDVCNAISNLLHYRVLPVSEGRILKTTRISWKSYFVTI